MDISVIIVAHNRIQQLKQVIPSIERQQISHELVIIDDGSSDGTHKWIDDLRLNNLRFIRIAPHFWRNPSHAKNYGVACAAGDVIIVQDAEILHESDILHQVQKGIASYEHPVFRASHTWYEEEGREPEFQPKPPRTCMLFAMYRRDFIALGGFNEKWYTQWGNDDVEFIERCHAACYAVFNYPGMKIRHLAHELPPDGDVERWHKECEWNNIYVKRLRRGKARPYIKWRH